MRFIHVPGPVGDQWFMLSECRTKGCRMERDGMSACETGRCIEALSKARSPIPPPPPPTAVVWSNDAARGSEFAHCASEPGFRQYFDY